MPRLFNPGTVFRDTSDVPAAGGTVTFYESGTTTKKDTYSDIELASVNPNPITLDSDGTFPGEVFGAGDYTVLVKDANGATLPGSVDDVEESLSSYTVATLPSASVNARLMIYVSDETGGAVPAFSDGTNWRRVTDRAIVS